MGQLNKKWYTHIWHCQCLTDKLLTYTDLRFFSKETALSSEMKPCAWAALQLITRECITPLVKEWSATVPARALPHGKPLQPRSEFSTPQCNQPQPQGRPLQQQSGSLQPQSTSPQPQGGLPQLQGGFLQWTKTHRIAQNTEKETTKYHEDGSRMRRLAIMFVGNRQQ